ncbi:MAG: SctK family type III secretion system sorting platform protein [Thiotrichales bacterium]
MDRTQLNARTDGTSVSEAVRFNLYPGSYIHEDWFDRLRYGAIIRELVLADPFENSISKYLLREFEIDDRFSLGSDRPVDRLALRDRRTIEEFALFLGVYLNRRSILKSIRGDRLRQLAGVLPASGEALLRDLYRGQILMREPAGIHPDAFLRLPYKAIVVSGELALAAALRATPKAMSQRCWIKLGPRYQGLSAGRAPVVEADEFDATISRFFTLENESKMPGDPA